MHTYSGPGYLCPLLTMDLVCVMSVDMYGWVQVSMKASSSILYCIPWTGSLSLDFG